MGSDHQEKRWTRTDQRANDEETAELHRGAGSLDLDSISVQLSSFHANVHYVVTNVYSVSMPDIVSLFFFCFCSTFLLSLSCFIAQRPFRAKLLAERDFFSLLSLCELAHEIGQLLGALSITGEPPILQVPPARHFPVISHQPTRRTVYILLCVCSSPEFRISTQNAREETSTAGPTNLIQLISHYFS
ncbi:uncharacterized protein BCR38DRAFT_167513 [Pseudomassariella vexata]|uniref:Uncharacterized protein n=1 Tax=Pseudomassariella vexata TaxID=1141098 RepID=A0A1Y2E2W7_9PEZI|nr:uncharacterized protein BCR38DRAFT_167513 [Pseudomassariella vexata]ORY65849.1 hypothetical protein BCR38DRAFT_167513 [Pseudomassariella vexata]